MNEHAETPAPTTPAAPPGSDESFAELFESRPGPIPASLARLLPKG